MGYLTNKFYVYSLGDKNKKVVLKKNLENSLIESLDKIVKELYVPKPEVDSLNSEHRKYLDNYYLSGDASSLEKFLEKTSQFVEEEVDYLRPGVLGMYDVSTDRIYIRKGLSSEMKAFVLAHERAHRRRAYTGESQNEADVDREAAEKSGVHFYREAI